MAKVAPKSSKSEAAKRDPAHRDPAKIARIRRNLLDWYTLYRRDLPWRRDTNPYAVWVSEIMLQQTRVAAVIERYRSFLERFPTVLALALAPEQDVLAEWSGLGYYRRARMLHKAAQFLAASNEGNLPTTSAELGTLPGIGPYTAAAIASIAHNESIAVVDGNVERVLCRLEGWDHGHSGGAAALARKIESHAQALVDPTHPGDFNQAIMELGATVCAPRNPQCVVCPLVADCTTKGEHKTAPRPRMLSREVAFALCLRDTPAKAGAKGSAKSGSKRKAIGQALPQIFLVQRPESQTVMPGLWELPALKESAVPDGDLRMTVRHAIMQINYYVRIRTVPENEIDTLAVPSSTSRWVPLAEAAAMPLTGLARKVLMRAHLLSS
jgi:A/G-specific adenine glycosylase